ncbi:putative RNA recognition motif domain, nucleotide-binding alpha-beta plait domain superfamily [Helianthus anomalus]
MMSNEEEKRCPLCAEEMDWTDQQLKPCKCGYEVWVPANNSSRKQKQPKAKQKPNEVKKDLSNVRVIQRRMAYIIGLPISLADEDLLQRKDYFGRYGKVTKVSLSRTAGGTVQQFVNDTCSVYITYSKEEEAVRCIQSVHGYVLDGRFLRASFGTAKYCHAWLRNTPCNNVACLYLHSIGAEEDSFGKDEIAAVHTRNRVQEIVGATEYLHKRSGSTLPSPVDEHSNSRSASAQEPVFTRCQEDVAYAAVASGDHLFCSKDKDRVIKLSKHTTSFVDIVGRSYNSGSDKDTSSSISEGPMLNICSDMSSVCVNRSNHDNAEGSHLVSPKSSTSKLYSEPFREASRLPSVELDDLTLKDTNITKEQSCLNPVGVVKTYSDDAWWHTESSSQNDYGVNNNANSLLSNGYDRIYGGSKSFFNEEIVEQLRRLDDSSLADDDENSAAVENSIISNILSMDFDGCEDSVLPRTVTGLFEGKDGRHGSSWSFQNSDHSRFSFANEDSVENQDRAYKPHYQAPTVQSVIPPGFSKPPPGFSSGVRSEPVVSASSGSLSNSSDDLIDPAIMAVGRGNSSSYDTRSSSFNEETKLWLLMQQQQQSASATHHHDPRTSFMQQHISPRFPSRDDYYKDLISRLVDQSYTQQQYSHPKFSNGHITNGYRQLHLDGAQQVNTRNEVGGLQERIHGNGRFGLEKLLSGYGDYKFQMPSSGDVYTRVFGM